MATETTRTRATAAQSEAFVADQLTRAQQRIRWLDLLGGVLVLLTATLAFFLVTLLLDRAWTLSAPVRITLLGLYLITAALIAGWSIVRPLLHPINPYYVARQMELTLPGAKNSVINWLDLHDQPLAPAIRGAINHRAARDLKQADLEQALPGRHTHLSGAAVGVLAVLLVVLFIWFGPSQFRSLLGRALFPFEPSTGIATRTRIQVIRPEEGNAILPAGLSVTILARVEGQIPDPRRADALRLNWRYNPQEPYQERPLQPYESAHEWGSILSASDVREGFLYKITGGDAETPEYQVIVRANPKIEEFQATYHYRDHVGKVDEIRRDRKIEALRGTEVTLRVQTNRQVKSAQMILDTNKQTLPGKLLADDPKSFTVNFVVGDSGLYRLSFQSVEDETYTDNVLYPVISIRDQAPIVEITRPGKDMEMAVNGLLMVEGKASDDIGVKTLTLQLKALGGPALRGQQYRAERGGLRLASGEYPRLVDYKDVLDLGRPLMTTEGNPYVLQPGMEVEYWLEATDTCDDPHANVTQSKRYKLKLTAPQQDPKKQQQERDQVRKEREQHQANEDKQRQQEEQQRKEKANHDRDKLNEQKNKTQAGQGSGENNQNPNQQGSGLDPKDEAKTKEQADQINKAANQDQGNNSGEKGQSKGNDQPGQSKEGAKSGGDPSNPENKQGDGKGEKRGESKPEGAKGDNSQGGQSKEGGKSGQSKDAASGKDFPKQGKQEPQGQAKEGQGKNDSGATPASEGKDGGQNNPQPGQEGSNGQGGKADKAGEGKGNAGTPDGKQNQGQAKATDKAQAGQAGGQEKQAGKGDPKDAQAAEHKAGPPSNGEQVAGKERGQGEPMQSPGDTGTRKPSDTPGQGERKPGEGKGPPGEGRADTESAAKPERRDPANANLKDLQQLNKKLQSPDEATRREANQELEKIQKEAKDEQIRDLAQQLARDQKPGTRKPLNSKEEKESPKENPGDAGTPGSPPKTDPMAKEAPGSGKDGLPTGKNGMPPTKEETSGDGKGSERNKNQGLAKGEGQGTRDDKGQGKLQGVPRGGGDVNLERPGHVDGQKEVPGGKDIGKPTDQRATETQLEQFKKLLDKKMLERLNMTEEAREQFLKNYSKLVQRDKTRMDPIVPDVKGPRGTGKLPSTVSTTPKTNEPPPVSDIGAKFNGKPPPGFQNDYADFINRLNKLSQPK
jgi:hypothetical protein